VSHSPLHEQLLGIPALRDALSEYGAPSQGLQDFLWNNVRPEYRTLEIGCSATSLQLAHRAATHACIVPDQAAAEALRQVADAAGIAPGRLEILVGEPAVVATALPPASFDHVVLTPPMAFPDYFAAAHAGFRALRPGRKLTVCGSGVWTVEQLRNFLRIDPAWDGFELVSADATAITRQPGAAAARPAAWREQPYVLFNSIGGSGAAAREARLRAERNRVVNFSTEAEAMGRRKAVGSAQSRMPRVGLVGYYGFGNYGDELFRLAFEAGLPEFELPMLHDIPRRPYFLEDKARKVERVDAIVIGGGDLIIPGYWTDFYFEREFLAKPVFIHGVGVPRWTGGEGPIIKRLREFMQHPSIRYINVRDEESREWVAKHLDPKVAPFITPDIVCGMDLHAAPPPREAGRRVFGLITRKQQRDESNYAPLRALVDRARAEGYFIRQIIAGNGPVGDEDYADAMMYRLPSDEVVLADTVEATTRAILGCDIMASMKFHGCVVGLMSGIPTLGLLTTDKFNSFYRDLGVERLICHFRNAALPDAFPLLAEALPMEGIARHRLASAHGMATLRAALRAELPG
jgi:polysaccharide pyruvyl transferase WcaK-like protein